MSIGDATAQATNKAISKAPMLDALNYESNVCSPVNRENSPCVLGCRWDRNMSSDNAGMIKELRDRICELHAEIGERLSETSARDSIG